MESHYDTLGVERTASFDEVKAAYRRLAQKYHPDKNRQDPVHSAELFTRVRLAYETLISPESRRQHDDELARHASFQAELARRRNAYAHATASSAEYDATGHTSSRSQPTDWHARAWELVQRAPGVDALARALRSEGCLPSLAAPLARDVAREFEQLKQATAHFQAQPASGAQAYRAAEASARHAGDRQAGDRQAGGRQEGERQAGERQAGGRQTSAQADPSSSRRKANGNAQRAGDTGHAQGARTRESTRDTGRETGWASVFGTRRQSSSQGNGRYAWVVVAAMVLLIVWRYAPSTRAPGLRTLGSPSRFNPSDDRDAPPRRLFRSDVPDTDEHAKNRRLLAPSDPATIERLLPGIDERRPVLQSEPQDSGDNANDAARHNGDALSGRIARPQSPDDTPVMPRSACAPDTARIGCAPAVNNADQ